MPSMRIHATAIRPPCGPGHGPRASPAPPSPTAEGRPGQPRRAARVAAHPRAGPRARARPAERAPSVLTPPYARATVAAGFLAAYVGAFMGGRAMTATAAPPSDSA